MKRSTLARTPGLNRTPMPRGTKPLKSGVPPVRHTPLVAKSAPKQTRRMPAVPRDVRAELVERSGGICEIQLEGCFGRGTQTHHRITTKQGGRHGAAKVAHDRLSDLLDVDAHCHHLVTHPPAWLKTYDLGLSLKERQIPSQEPVVYRGELRYLDDVGGVHDAEVVGA